MDCEAREKQRLDLFIAENGVKSFLNRHAFVKGKTSRRKKAVQLLLYSLSSISTIMCKINAKIADIFLIIHCWHIHMFLLVSRNRHVFVVIHTMDDKQPAFISKKNECKNHCQHVDLTRELKHMCTTKEEKDFYDTCLWYDSIRAFFFFSHIFLVCLAVLMGCISDGDVVLSNLSLEKISSEDIST